MRQLKTQIKYCRQMEKIDPTRKNERIELERKFNELKKNHPSPTPKKRKKKKTKCLFEKVLERCKIK